MAQTYTLNDTAFAPPEGIMELIDATNAVLPEGMKAAEKDIASFKLKRKRAMAQSVITASTAAGGAVGAIPLPFADAAILVPVESGLVTALRKIYGIPDGDDAQKIMDTILEVGTASIAAKAAISALKTIPGVNLAGEVINAIVAAAIVAAIGEMSAKDVDAIRNLIEQKLDNEFVRKVTEVIEDFAGSDQGKNSLKDLAGNLVKTLGPSAGKASS